MRDVGRLWLVVLVVDAVAMAILGHSLMPLTPQDLLWGVIVGTLIAWVELHPLNINDDGDLTVSALVEMVALLRLGLPATLIGVLLSEAAYCLLQRRPLIKTCFNSGQTIVALAVAYHVWMGVGGRPGTLSIHAFALALTFIVVNTLLVSSILALSQRQPLWRTWIARNRDTLAYSTILAIGGLAFGGLILSYNWLGLGLAAVLLLCLQAVLAQASFNLRTLKVRFLQTVRVTMTALEYRDPYTYGHSSRVAGWCRKIAAEMGLPPEEVERIELGGLVHDVGKVGVPDQVLNKPGALTPEEFEQIKAHTLIGERIILGMEGMEQVAAMARHHHLFYNGDPRGYPDAQIPGRDTYIGSRILSVADSWDAMTADRPYRRALPVEQAVVQLQHGRGTQFDPGVVDTFLRVLAAEGLLTGPVPLAVPEGRDEAHGRAQAS